MSIQRVLVRARTNWPQVLSRSSIADGNATQRSNNSLDANLENLKRRICLAPASAAVMRTTKCYGCAS